MNALYNGLFLLQFLSYWAVLFYMTYNIISGFDKFGSKPMASAFMLFCVAILAYGIGLTVMIVGYDEMLFLYLQMVQTLSLGLLFIYLMIFLIKYTWESNVRPRHNAEEYYNGRN